MNDKDPVQKYAEDLKETISKTRGSRFNAVRRLESKNEWSIASISVLSVYSIAIAIIQNVLDFSQCQNLNNIYTLSSILLSIFILVISLLEGAKNYQLKADRLHSNALELSIIYRKIEYLVIENLEKKEYIQKLCDLATEYEQVIKGCPENHKPVDYTLFKLEEKKKLKKNQAEQNIQENVLGTNKNANQDELNNLRTKKICLILKNLWLYIVLIFCPIPLILWLYLIFKCS